MIENYVELISAATISQTARYPYCDVGMGVSKPSICFISVSFHVDLTISVNVHVDLTISGNVIVHVDLTIFGNVHADLTISGNVHVDLKECHCVMVDVNFMLHHNYIYDML